MQFGFTLKPDHTIERTVALTRQAEAAGFDYGWIFDSHVLWREPYPLLTLMAQAHDAPPPRDLRDQPGDPRADRSPRPPWPCSTSSPAAGWTSASAAATPPDGSWASRRPRWPRSRRRSRVIKALVEGRTIEYEGTELQLPWTGKWTLPVWVAGYGPMALAMAGRVADGLILQLADPDLIRWFVGQVREAAAAAGRDPSVDPGPGRRAGLRRPARGRPRADALVPGARLQPRRRSRQQVPARGAAGQPDRLHPRPDGLRLPPPRRGRLVQRGVRRRRGDRPVLRARLAPTSTSPSCASWPTRASTSSTST